MLKLILLSTFSIFCSLSNAQVATNRVVDFTNTNPAFKKYARKNLTFLGGLFTHGTFQGGDSINITPFVRKATVANFYINNKEICIEEYLLFSSINKCIYNGISLTPSAEPLANLTNDFLVKYISDKKNGKFPIVGISKAQAEAYCDWLTDEINKKYIDENSHYQIYCRLPTDAEYQLAIVRAFEANNIQNDLEQDLINANYANKKRAFGEFPFSKVNKNRSPKFRLFNIIGNVSEWVLDTPRDLKVEKKVDGKYILTGEVSFRIPADLKKLGHDKLGMVKGGSFDQNSFYLQPGVSTPLEKNKGYMDVGFRPLFHISRKPAG